MSRNFALVGAAGYIAPFHMRAISETKNRLVAAFDPHDSVGVLDRWFPEASFFTSFERFDRHVDALRRAKDAARVDVVSICSPNHLHDAHIRFALRSGADAICEKPVVLNPWNLDALIELERETGHSVSTILQLRLHPAVAAMRARRPSPNAKSDVELTYVTPRGRWYLQSWKGEPEKSGGIATNIGIHFFDMLHFVFGRRTASVVHYASPTKASGFLECEEARVRWFLSVDGDDVPARERERGARSYRSMFVDGTAFELDDGFTDLHTRCYAEILDGRGFSLADCREALETAATIRTATAVGLVGDYHPLLAEVRK